MVDGSEQGTVGILIAHSSLCFSLSARWLMVQSKALSEYLLPIALFSSLSLSLPPIYFSLSFIFSHYELCIFYLTFTEVLFSAQHHPAARGGQVGQVQHGGPAPGARRQPGVQDQGRPHAAPLRRPVNYLSIYLFIYLQISIYLVYPQYLCVYTFTCIHLHITFLSIHIA